MTKFDQKREEIKKAGIKSFSKFGFYKTTMDDIAKMLGMKKNSLYYYFENKDALFREIIEDKIAEHMDITNKIAEKDIPAREKLLEATKCLIGYIRERMVEYAVTMTSFLEVGKVIRTNFPEFKENQGCVFLKILKEGVVNKEFKPSNMELLSKDLAELIPALFTQNYLNSNVEFVSEIDFDSLTQEINRIITYILDGIALENKKAI